MGENINLVSINPVKPKRSWVQTLQLKVGQTAFANHWVKPLWALIQFLAIVTKTLPTYLRIHNRGE